MQEQANLEDIARFFAGFELMGNPVTMVKEVSRTWGKQLRLHHSSKPRLTWVLTRELSPSMPAVQLAYSHC